MCVQFNLSLCCWTFIFIALVVCFSLINEQRNIIIIIPSASQASCGSKRCGNNGCILHYENEQLLTVTGGGKMDMNEAMKTNQSFHLSLINVLTARGNVRNIH